MTALRLVKGQDPVDLYLHPIYAALTRPALSFQVSVFLYQKHRL